MKFSLTVVFFLLFLVVVAAYVYLVPSGVKPETGSVTLNSRLLPMDENDEIISLEIVNAQQKEKIVFLKEGQDWLLKEPVAGQADKLLVDGLAAALTLSLKARRLSPEAGWQEYGLQEPRLSVGVVTRKNPDMRKLFFGDKSPVADFNFARWEDEKEYFLLDPNLMKAFQRSAYSFREKRIFHQPLKELSKIRVQNESEVYEVNRQASGWVWVEPIAFIGQGISPRNADLMINALRGLFIKDFLGAETEASDKGFGLLGPETVLEMQGAQDAQSEVLRLGDELPARDAFYARKDGDPEVFLVSREKIGEIFALFRSAASSEVSQEPQETQLPVPAHADLPQEPKG